MNVIVPAHNEELVIAGTVARLVGVPGLTVLVVCNGCTDRTAERARAAGATVIEIPEASKAAALTAGDAGAVGWPRAYLDADVELDGRALLDVANAMASAAKPAGTVALQLDGSHSTWPVRSFGRVWSQLPQVRDGLAGRGLYVLDAAGRERVGPWPAVGDDYLVERSFAAHERVVDHRHHSTVRLPPDVGQLVRQKQRVHRGNAAVADAVGGHRSGLWTVVRERRAGLHDVAVYAAITALTKLTARRGAAWASPTRTAH